MFTAAIITASDKGYAGEREDLSGKAVEEILLSYGYTVLDKLILPDELDRLSVSMKELADEKRVNLIVTTGGTGFSQRDVTPEATISVCHRMAPGIAEAIRANSMAITKRAMLSRAVCGIRGETLILNLPGSPKAVAESLSYVIEDLGHGLSLLLGKEGECAR